MKLTTKQLVMAALFAALIAVGAFIKIPIGIVPITFQTLFVLLAGLLLGPRTGTASVAAYLFIGLLGLPIFTMGGGPGYVLQPTFGYMIGFCFAACLSGALVRRAKKKTFLTCFTAALAGLLPIYLIGLPYFYLITNFYAGRAIDVPAVLVSCFLVFLPNELFSCVIAAILAKKLSPILKIS